MQITIENISEQTQHRLEALAKTSGKSFNETALEVIDRGLRQSPGGKQFTDLDWFIGSGTLEPEVIQAIKEHDIVHPEDHA